MENFLKSEKEQKKKKGGLMKNLKDRDHLKMLLSKMAQDNH